MTTVELRGVGKVYPDGHVGVHDVDLRIEDGEFFVLAGPSGCGKTTVLRMVAGLERPSHGTVAFDDDVVDEVRTSERDVAMLFQTTALYPHLDVRANLGFPLKMAHRPNREIRKRVADVAERLGISELLDRVPGRLSGGQRQRVAMGRALVREPRLLLMDEPMSNLDAKLRTELRADLAATQQRLGVTTIYVTHDQVEAMALGHRIAVMRDGRIVQCGPPIEVYEHPVDLFVATFVGSPPMNVLVAEVVDERRLRFGRHEVDLGPSAARWPTLATYAERDVLVGVRPESIGLSEDGDLMVEVLHVESLGAERFAIATFDARGIRPAGEGWRTESPTTVSIAVEAPTVADPFRPVSVRIDPERIHLFDRGDGSRLPGSDDVGGDVSAGGDGLVRPLGRQA